MSYGSSSYASAAYGATSGVPFGQVSGFSSTQYGTPIIGNIECLASSTNTTQYGTPAGSEKFTAESLGIVTVFGSAYGNSDITAYAQGFLTTKYPDWVYSTQDPAPGSITCTTQGFRLTFYGTPTSRDDITLQADGIFGTSVGTPTAITTCAASGTYGTNLGTPLYLAGMVSNGFSTTQYGAPVLNMITLATSIAPAIRFGTPLSSRENCYLQTSTVPTTRYGIPRYSVDSIYGAGSITETQFGTPAGFMSYRMRQIPPTSIFGTPTAKRTPLC